MPGKRPLCDTPKTYARSMAPAAGLNAAAIEFQERGRVAHGEEPEATSGGVAAR